TVGARIGARGVTGWRHALSSLFLLLMNDSLLYCLANEEHGNRGTLEQIFRNTAKKPAPQSRFPLRAHDKQISVVECARDRRCGVSPDHQTACRQSLTLQLIDL